MIRKLLEACFRHKLLLLVAPVLIPGIVTPIALLTAPTAFDTTTTIWVDHPAYLSYQDGTSPWVTPSGNHKGRLTELLHTRAFEADVATRTSLAPLVGTPVGEQRIDDLIVRSVTLANPGDHLLVVAVSAPTARLSYELCTALVAAYQEKSEADQADQTNLAVSYYQGRIAEADQQVTKTGQDLRRYLATKAANSDPTASLDPNSMGSIPAALLDPKLAALQASAQQAQSDVNNARGAQLAAQRDAAAAAQGQQLGWQILDAARVPSAPTRQLRKILVYPVAAAVAGLGLSGVLLVLFVAADRSARGETDLTPGLRLLGVVPTLGLKRVPKHLRGVATRRAIGAAAGMALPAAPGSR